MDPKDLPETITIGDVVILRTGGPEMTVTGFASGDRVEVTRFHLDADRRWSKHVETYPSAALRLCVDVPVMKFTGSESDKALLKAIAENRGAARTMLHDA